MTIKVAEVKKLFRYSTNFDMSGSTGLTLKFTKPNGGTLTKTEASSNPVTAPATALTNDPDIGTVAASTYMQFSTVASDFDVAGVWKVCGIYTDGDPTEYFGDLAVFTVEFGC